MFGSQLDLVEIKDPGNEAKSVGIVSLAFCVQMVVANDQVGLFYTFSRAGRIKGTWITQNPRMKATLKMPQSFSTSFWRLGYEYERK